MSKLSFRARAVDASKQMPVFLAEELPDLSEYASINRAVPQMPTGMEKDEEMELHLQQAISAQQRSSTGATVASADNAIIPIPKVTSDVKYYERIYPPDYRLPKQLIKVQAALNLEPEIPDYDLDSEDERWLLTHGQKMDVSPLQFERIMDALEKQSEFKVITPLEAKLLLQEDDDMLLAVYDYWLTKRYMAASQGKNLIPRVKTEKREGTGAKHNPYVAFRRRAEKMQTRKNRRNDEESYEKILKLRHDLQKAVTLAEMVKRREKSKREMINLTLDIVEKRFVLEDFREELFSLICNEAKPSFRFSKQEMVPAPVNNNKKSPPASKKRKTPLVVAKEDKGLVSREWLLQNAEDWNRPPASFLTSPKVTTPVTSEDPASCRLEKVSTEVDGRYAFKRRRGCRYYAPLSSSTSESDSAPLWPWEQPKSRLLYFPTHMHSRHTQSNANLKTGVNALRFVGSARRRVGRGGRMLFDRASSSTSIDDQQSTTCDDFPSTSAETVVHRHVATDRKKSLIFRPSSPPLLTELDNNESDEFDSTSQCQSVPFATVVGPRGVLRLPLSIGLITSNEGNGGDQRRKSPMPVAATSTNLKQLITTTENTSLVQKQLSSSSMIVDSNRFRSDCNDSRSTTNSTPTRDRNRKRSSNVSIFGQPVSSEILSATTNSSTTYLSSRSENNNNNNDNNNGEQKFFPPTNNNVNNQWRKQQDFGATTALLMRPPVRLPISGGVGLGNQSFESTSTSISTTRQSKDPRATAPRPAAQLYGIAATPTTTSTTTSATKSNNFLLNAFKGGGGGGQATASGNNGKFGLGVAAAKGSSPHQLSSAHTYALPPNVDYSRQNSSSAQQQQQSPTLTRTMSSSGLATSGPTTPQYDTGQGTGVEHSMPNGPQQPIERLPRRRPYAARTQQQTANATAGGSGGVGVGVGGGGGVTKLASASGAVQPPPANLPLDHGSYHASSFMPPPVAVVSVSLANGSVTQEQTNAGPETAITAQFNGQRNYRDQPLANTPPSSSNNVIEFTHPLPTPSPSPNARFYNIDSGGTVTPKYEDIKSSVSAVVGRLTPTTAVGKSRKSSDE